MSNDGIDSSTSHGVIHENCIKYLVTLTALLLLFLLFVILIGLLRSYFWFGHKFLSSDINGPSNVLRRQKHYAWSRRNFYWLLKLLWFAFAHLHLHNVWRKLMGFEHSHVCRDVKLH